MSWFQALQVYLLSLFEKLRDPFVLLWFMSVHLEATPSRCSQSCERSVASCGVQQRSAASSSALAQKRPAAGGHINKWTVGTFPFSLMWLQNLQIWVNSKFKDVTCNHRPFLQKKWILAEDLGANWCLRCSAIFKPKRKWNWHLAHVQPTRPVSFARPQCCSAAGTLFSVGSASSQIPHRRPAFIGFPFKRNRPFRGQIWFATPHVEKDRPALWT